MTCDLEEYILSEMEENFSGDYYIHAFVKLCIKKMTT